MPPYAAAIDPAGQFIYFASRSNTTRIGRIIKVRLSDFKRVGSLDLTAGKALLIDPQGAYAYLANNSGEIIKIRLSDFTQVDLLALDPKLYSISTGMMSPAGDYAYFATYGTSPGRLIKIGLADFTLDGTVDIETNACCSVIDPAGAFGYIGGEHGVVKVRLADMNRIAALGIPAGYPICAVMDPAGKYLYLGGRDKTISKMQLSDFTLESQLGILPGQGVMLCAAIAPRGDFGFFTAWDSTGVNAVKVALNGISQAIHATRVTLSESARINKVNFYSHQAGGNLRLAIYGNDPGRPLLWESPSFANTISNGWCVYPASMGTAEEMKLRAGTYWLAFNTDSPLAVASYTTGTLGEGYMVLQPFGAYPAVLNGMDNNSTSARWSAYFTYTPIFIDTPPTVPQVTLAPAAPGTLDDITATAAASDPDTAVGDSVSAWRYEWSVDGEVKSTSRTLSAALTARGQQWTCKAWAMDGYGLWSAPGQASATIVNTPPTQPLVEIRPKPARAGEALIVDVQTYSTDADGDTIAYDFNWFKSSDGGTSWIHKVELDGSPQVSGPYILDGEIWEVHYIPYEKTLAAKQGNARPGSPTAAAARVEGRFAWDRAYIGANNPPKLALDTPVARRQASGKMVLSLGWTFSDADGDYCTIDLDWTDLKASGYQAVARGLPARQGAFSGLVAMPWDRPVAIHGVIRDTKGAIAQQISATVRLLPPAATVVVDYLLGKTTNPAGLDVNLDQKVTIADVLAGASAALPDTPAGPAPSDGTRGVSRTPTLAWSGGAHTQGWQLYLWRPKEARPAAPLAALAAAARSFQVTNELLPGTLYCWQVIAMGGTYQTTGPVWAFTTQP